VPGGDKSGLGRRRLTRPGRASIRVSAPEKHAAPVLAVFRRLPPGRIARPVVLVHSRARHKNGPGIARSVRRSCRVGAMAKTREQRTKELTKPSAVRAAWGAINAKYKEFNAPIFLKLGNIAGRAQDYDNATKAFLDAAKKKEDSKKLSADIVKQVKTVDTRVDGLNKERDSVKADEEASMKEMGGDTPEDYLEALDNSMKKQQDVNKATQSIFDNIIKALDSRVKAMSDGYDKLEKAVNDANSALDQANKDIDAAEQDIRKFVRAYYATALDMNKKDMADAVNKLIAEFGK
jgi:chromosome segregation ATPase